MNKLQISGTIRSQLLGVFFGFFSLQLPTGARGALQEVFEPGFSSLQRTYDLQLEDLAQKTNVTPQLMLKNLAIGVFAPPRAVQLSSFYSKAVKRLKAAAPNLETVEFNGGYVSYPKNPNNATELRDEIEFLAAYFSAISLALQHSNLTMKSGIFNIAVVFSENAKKTSNFEELLLEKFGNSSVIDDTAHEGVEMLADVGGSEFRVNFAIITDIDVVKKGRLPKGQTPFRRATEKFLLPFWIKTMREAQNHSADPFQPLFPDGIKRLANVRQVHLEDFCGECGFPGEQHELVQLMLGMAVPPSTNTASLYVFYSSAMQNLKSTLPNLKRIRLAGGYIQRSDENDKSQLLAELSYLRNLLRSVVKAARQQKLQLLGINFRTVWMFPELSFHQKEFVAELKKRFGHEPSEDAIVAKDFDFTTEIDAVRCHVFLSLADPVPGITDQMPAGRLPYYPTS